jgi:glycosyltransferase involved in cell wall biosynthesis
MNPTHQGPRLSVVMPAFNEEDQIEDAVREVAAEVLDRVEPSELLVVNDGSTDGTGAILDRLMEEDPRLRVIHQTNGGHGAALLTGLDAATGEWLLLVDSDRQIPLASFQDLWSAIQGGAHAAFGWRRNRNDPLHRLWLTALIRFVLRRAFELRVNDVNVPFKLIPLDSWLAARPLIPDGTLAPSLFLGVLIGTGTLDCAEIEVPHRQRAVGTSTLRPWRLIAFCARGLGQLLRLRREMTQ